MKFDLLTLGSAVVDKVVCGISDDFLASLGLEKGNNYPNINYEHDFLIKASKSQDIVTVPGGSAANVTKVAAGFGLKCAYISKIGKDHWGSYYKDSFIQRGIVPYFSISNDYPTASALCLVTPDGERTMCPDLRACKAISAQDISPAYFDRARLFHLDGYNFYYEEAIERALELAIEKECPISLDMCSHQLIRSHYDTIMSVIESHTLELLFANEREATELAKTADPIEACKILSKYCPTVTVMMGSKGSVTICQEKMILKPAKAVKAVDTTGAGDMYVGGYLYGYLTDCDIEECMEIGTQVAAQGVQIRGGELPIETFAQLKESLSLV